MTAPRPEAGQAGGQASYRSDTEGTGDGGIGPVESISPHTKSAPDDLSSPAPSAEIEARLEEIDQQALRADECDSDVYDLIDEAVDPIHAAAFYRSTIRSLLAERERLVRERDDYRDRRVSSRAPEEQA